MLRIRATTISKVVDSYIGEPSVYGRFEFSHNNSKWVNVSAHVYTEVEWLMLVSLLILGARTVPEVEVEHVVLEPPDAKPERVDCANIG